MITQQPFFGVAGLYLRLLHQSLSLAASTSSLLHRVRFKPERYIAHIIVLLVCKTVILRRDKSNTDLLLHSFDEISMQLRQKRKALLYAGIGFVLIGIVSMVLTYILLY